MKTLKPISFLETSRRQTKYMVMMHKDFYMFDFFSRTSRSNQQNHLFGKGILNYKNKGQGSN